MNTNKRTKSISRKINSRNVFKMFLAFIVIDLLVIILPVLFWCSSIESAYTDTYDNISNRRFVTVSEVLSEENSNTAENYAAYKQYIESKDINQKLFLPINSFKTSLSSTFYMFEGDNETSHYTYCGTLFISLASNIFIILVIEILILIGNAISGARKIRYHLAPLDELAFKAEMLGNVASFDQHALDQLEHAINDMSPAKESTHLNTGNAEMESLEKSINGLLDRMRESYKRQSRFVSDASHELRTPISVLQGYVNMLDRWGKNDEKVLEESIDAIKSETEHMKTLVEQLLFLARGDSGRTKMNMLSFSLNDMMSEVYEECLMIDRDHTYKYKPHIEDIHITGDISMLKQTARIIIDNAAKYTPTNASIVLKTNLNESGIPSFIIQDEGIGISSKDVPHMFERFYRSDPARTKDSGGTGLGLSIAKWIIDRHDGYIDVLSREEIGTRITVYLPQK